jgi:hypothetical protein
MDAFTHATFAPVFVIGYPRSGTTLLAEMLGRHSRMAAPPETQFGVAMMHRRIAPESLPREHGALADALYDLNPRLHDIPVPRDAVRARFERYPPHPSGFLRALLETYGEAERKPLVIEKSPGHLLYASELKAWYPQARFVWIVRDGRDAVLSMLRMPWAHNFLALHCAEWVYRMAEGEAHRAAAPTRFHLLRYEDLLREPESTLDGVCRFIGERFESDQLDPDQRGGAVPVWEARWKGKVREGLDPSRIGAWVREADPRQQSILNGIMGQRLRRLGYDVPPVRVSPSAIWALLLQERPYRTLRGAIGRVKHELHRRHLRVPFSRAHVVERLRRDPLGAYPSQPLTCS